MMLKDLLETIKARKDIKVMFAFSADWVPFNKEFTEAAESYCKGNVIQFCPVDVEEKENSKILYEYGAELPTVVPYIRYIEIKDGKMSAKQFAGELRSVKDIDSFM